MGRYSNTKLAHGTNGSPQITIDENIYALKINEVIKQLNLPSENFNKALSTGASPKGGKQTKNKNILMQIIKLITNMGYAKTEINGSVLYIKNKIILKIAYIEEYEYYILEKAEDVNNATNNIFEVLASISNEIKPKLILQTIKNILLKLEK